MHAFKQILKTFIGSLLMVVGCIALVGTLIGGAYYHALGIAVALVAYLVISGWDNLRDERKFREAVQARGLNLDYFVRYFDGGVVIDLDHRKLLVGNLKNGKILSFDDVKTVEWEDTPMHNRMKFNIYVNTHDFETPRVGAGFAGNKAMRDAAYAKLSAALKLV